MSLRLRRRNCPGQRAAHLPGTVALAAEFDVSQSTASRALASLRADGLVYVVSGRGYYVAEAPPAH
ncbi:GntR family transcriptional regulator [Streptomyces sp. NPDC006967]|uniref:GntR family transcriptional regulator n=1 Tax=unclassified Streptomyces TaxID=2593676 RepID=UPI000CD4ACED|nr:GntR family transcriptional regulator [Streptomyces sp. SM1]